MVPAHSQPLMQLTRAVPILLCQPGTCEPCVKKTYSHRKLRLLSVVVTFAVSSVIVRMRPRPFVLQAVQLCRSTGSTVAQQHRQYSGAKAQAVQFSCITKRFATGETSRQVFTWATRQLQVQNTQKPC
jgi:hypothetical protein